MLNLNVMQDGEGDGPANGEEENKEEKSEEKITNGNHESETNGESTEKGTFWIVSLCFCSNNFGIISLLYLQKKNLVERHNLYKTI